MVFLDFADFDSPVGTIRIAARDGNLCALNFADRWPAQMRWLERRFGQVTLREADDAAGITVMTDTLRRYFDGQLDALETLVVDPGGTPFQAHVWRALRTIPAGRTVSYGELARAVGSPQAARAVGAANGRNPVSLVIPCHRAIGGNRQLVGYGGGLDRKRWLLTHEGALAPTLPDHD
jgi:methylated-DNA-[protein]-cysteine S-methyltransferase